jgi:hypothetical protein
MHKRKIRKHQSGVANFLVTTSSLGGSGETFHDTMRKTMTQSLNKQLPTVTQKYAEPTVVDPRTSYPEKFPKRNISLNFKDTVNQRRPFDNR